MPKKCCFDLNDAPLFISGAIFVLMILGCGAAPMKKNGESKKVELIPTKNLEVSKKVESVPPKTDLDSQADLHHGCNRSNSPCHE